MSDLIGQAKLATDTISRRKAIEVIESELDKMDHVPQWVFDRLTDRLRELPSAQPEPLTINFARELDRETIEKVKESMKNAPVLIMAVNDDSADAVEVVRCKYCDFWNDWDSAGKESLGNHVCSCAYWTREDGPVVYTADNDFCSNGDRREE